MTAFSIVFICTGNTCRSPMALAIGRRLFPASWELASAGVAAVEGAPASSHARFVVRDRGGELDDHRSRALSDGIVREADLLLTMTRAQRDELRRRHPDRADRIRALGDGRNGTREDVADPFGGSLEEYEAAYDQIEALLKAALPELLALAGETPGASDDGAGEG